MEAWVVTMEITPPPFLKLSRQNTSVEIPSETIGSLALKDLKSDPSDKWEKIKRMRTFDYLAAWTLGNQSLIYSVTGCHGS